MNGTNYVPLPYKPVEAYSVASSGVVVPSGAVTPGGYYYEWNDNGFIGNGWFLNIPTGPMALWGFKSDEEVEAYIAENQNLNGVFRKWGEYMDTLDDATVWEYIEYFKEAIFEAGGNACIHY